MYKAARELMDLVEESDPETDSLMSREADREFVTLRDQHSAVQNGKRSPVAPKTIEEAVETIKGLARERVNEFMKEEDEVITELAEERKK